MALARSFAYKAKFVGDLICPGVCRVVTTPVGEAPLPKRAAAELSGCSVFLVGGPAAAGINVRKRWGVEGIDVLELQCIAALRVRRPSWALSYGRLIAGA